MQTLVERVREEFGLPARAGVRDGKRRSRSDKLPEMTPYNDDGCDIHDRCLTCPLPRCRYEEPGGLRALLNEQRDRQILQLKKRGASVDELASRFGVSRRTVFRVLGSSKETRHDAAITVLPAFRAAYGRNGRRSAPPDSSRQESRCA